MQLKFELRRTFEATRATVPSVIYAVTVWALSKHRKLEGTRTCFSVFYFLRTSQAIGMFDISCSGDNLDITCNRWLHRLTTKVTRPRMKMTEECLVVIASKLLTGIFSRRSPSAVQQGPGVHDRSCNYWCSSGMRTPYYSYMKHTTYSVNEDFETFCPL